MKKKKVKRVCESGVGLRCNLCGYEWVYRGDETKTRCPLCKTEIATNLKKWAVYRLAGEDFTEEEE